MKCFWGIMKLKTVKYQILHYLCFWHVVDMLIFYSPNHFISSPYLFFPVSQMNVGEIKHILKHCEVSTIIFLWPSLGSLFLLVCSAAGTGKEKKNIFQCYFWASFPSPAPWSQLVLCPLCSFSLGLNLLQFILGFHQCKEAALWFQQICCRSMEMGKSLHQNSGLDEI